MHRSPLQLERHFFTKVEIASHADGVIGTPNSLGCEMDIGQAEDDPKRFQVILRIKLGSSENEKPTYTGEIHAVGQFRVDDKWPEDKTGPLVSVNGPALLLSAMRELVFNITSRGPWPPITLNTFTFVPLEMEKESSREIASK